MLLKTGFVKERLQGMQQVEEQAALSTNYTSGKNYLSPPIRETRTGCMQFNNI